MRLASSGPSRSQGGKLAIGTLVVLDDAHAFSQGPALTADRFARELSSRASVRFDHRALERLHESEIVIPFFGIKYDADALVSREGGARGPSEVVAALQHVSTDGRALSMERDVGDLFDPADTGFLPWRETAAFQGTEYRTRHYVYSRYQLLAARPLLEALGAAGIKQESLENASWVSKRLSRLRDLAVVLEALTPAFRPDIVLRLSGFRGNSGEWGAYYRRFDITGLLERIDWPAQQLADAAEDLLFTAHGFDPLRDWHDLVDLVHHSWTEKLRGDALLAWEHRVAAEILLRAYERLVASSQATPLPDLPPHSWAPRHYRLTQSRSEVDQILMRFGLSPHPSVVVVVEGQIETKVLRRILDERLRSSWTSLVRLMVARGIDQDVSAIAAMMAPRVSELDGDWLGLSRPPTHIVLVEDAEGRQATSQAREARRRKWLDRLAEELGPPWADNEGVRDQLSELIEVFVWDPNGASFELAHFSDRQLAVGLQAVSPQAQALPLDELAAAIGEARARHAGLGYVWKDWERPKPNKARLVSSLEDSLVGRVHDELSEGLAVADALPITQLVVRILQLASSTPRQGLVGLRVAESWLAPAVDSSR
jgi:hypothetical protein